MKAIYRPFSDNDVSALIELMALLGYDHSAASIVQNIKALRRSGGEVFVAERSGLVCGCVSAIVDTRLAEGSNGEIVSLVVTQNARGNGIGKGLVSEAENWLSGRVPQIRVRANITRESAHQFYKSLGYSLTKSQAVFTKIL